jgi:hypothetical protein
MESAMNRIHQCTNLDGRYLTGVVLKSNVVVTFLNNGKHLSFSSHYFEYILINCGRLVTCLSLLMPRKRFPTHSVSVSQTLQEQLFPPSTLRLDCLALLEDASLILTDYIRKYAEFSNDLADRSDWSLVYLYRCRGNASLPTLYLSHRL